MREIERKGGGWDGVREEGIKWKGRGRGDGGIRRGENEMKREDQAEARGGELRVSGVVQGGEGRDGGREGEVGERGKEKR